MSALFVGFAEYRYGAQSDHHGNAEEDLDVGTSRDLVDWTTFDKAYVCRCWCKSMRGERGRVKGKSAHKYVREYLFCRGKSIRGAERGSDESEAPKGR